MAPEAEAPATAAAPGTPALPPLSLHRRFAIAAFAVLIALGAAFYLWWGIAYHGWLDNGVYAVTIVLVLFGVAGLWLVAPAPASARA